MPKICKDVIKAGGDFIEKMMWFFLKDDVILLKRKYDAVVKYF